MTDATRIVLVLVFLCSIVIPCFAQDNVINACYSQRNGALRVVAAPGDCSKSELPISWNTTGPQGAPGPQGPPGPAPDMSAYYTKAQVDALLNDLMSQIAQPPKVYDSSGQFLGTLVDTTREDFNVYVPIIRAITLFSFGGGYFRQPGSETYLYYEGTSCDTEPHVKYENSHFVIRNASTYYTGDHDQSVRNIMAHSIRDENGICTQYPDGSDQRSVIKARQVVMPFAFPVALPLRFE